jgi:hypothetical protein
VRHQVLEHARFLTELSVVDYFFVTKLSANIALAALLNAIENYPCLLASELFHQLGSLKEFDLDDPEIEECREQLRVLYEQGGYPSNLIPALDHDAEMETKQHTTTLSPVLFAFASNNEGQVPSAYYGTACPTNQATRTFSDSSASYFEIDYGVALLDDHPRSLMNHSHGHFCTIL